MIKIKKRINFYKKENTKQIFVEFAKDKYKVALDVNIYNFYDELLKREYKVYKVPEFTEAKNNKKYKDKLTYKWLKENKIKVFISNDWDDFVKIIEYDFGEAIPFLLIAISENIINLGVEQASDLIAKTIRKYGYTYKGKVPLDMKSLSNINKKIK